MSLLLHHVHVYSFQDWQAPLDNEPRHYLNCFFPGSIFGIYDICTRCTLRNKFDTILTAGTDIRKGKYRYPATMVIKYVRDKV